MNGETVVITGATSGIGRATARKFGEEGANVGLLARSTDGLEGAKEDVESAGGEAVTVQTDVAEYDQVEQAAEQIEAEFGPIDIWINDAMTTIFSEFVDIEPEEYKRVTEVTYLGAIHGSRVALDRMMPRGDGNLVQVGSALSYRGIPLQSAYCGSKFAIRGFTESLRTELLHDDDSNIDVSMVQLPGINTPQFDHCRSHVDEHPQPMPPMYQPEVAADAIYWAAHHDRRELYVGRSTLKTIWGNKIAPWLVDRYLARTGYDGQFSDEDDISDTDNLFTPLSGDPGAHGDFDDQATSESLQLELSKHRRSLGIVLALVAAAFWKVVKE